MTDWRSGAQKSNVYKRDVFVTSWRFHNRAWQPQRHDRLPETSGTLWIHRGALTNQWCSLATGCGINHAEWGCSYPPSEWTSVTCDVSMLRNAINCQYFIFAEKWFPAGLRPMSTASTWILVTLFLLNYFPQYPLTVWILNPAQLLCAVCDSLRHCLR